MRILMRVLLLLPIFASCVLAQAPATAPKGLPFTLKKIGPNIWAAIDDANGDAGANSGFVIGEDGVAVIDSFENEAAAQALLGEIRKLTQLPVKFVVNTHYHLDHVAGNRVYAKEGAAIVGQRRVRTWIHTENLKLFGDKITPEQKAEVENLLAPDVTYDAGVTLYLGTRSLEVEFYEGHTGGDSVVTIPDAGVVFCGDLFWRNTLPNLIDATTSDWIPTLTELIANSRSAVPGGDVPAAATFVPGHGDVGTGLDVQEFQNYLVALRAMVEKSQQEGKTGEALVAAVMPELEAKYGNWEFFKDFSRSDILDTGAELQGTKRVPPRKKK
jgi:cyclase